METSYKYMQLYQPKIECSCHMNQPSSEEAYILYSKSHEIVPSSVLLGKYQTPMDGISILLLFFLLEEKGDFIKTRKRYKGWIRNIWTNGRIIKENISTITEVYNRYKWKSRPMSLRPDDKDRFASCKRSHKCCIQSQGRCKGFVEHSHWYQRIKFCSAKFKNFTWINVFFKAMETSLPNTYGRRIFIFYFSKRNGIFNMETTYKGQTEIFLTIEGEINRIFYQCWNLNRYR